FVSLSGKYVGSCYAINDTKNETPKAKEYFILNTKVSYKPTKSSLEVYVAANNLLNKEYSSYVVKSTSSGKKDYYPSPERNFTIGVNYRF
ncbi:MAG: TonB-dependent receptor, partial [Candidatus Omnitrophica bacterium]|nr:TonB-dependent receptor [Candidatus Omnitrophota bacterium]